MTCDFHHFRPSPSSISFFPLPINAHGEEMFISSCPHLSTQVVNWAYSQRTSWWVSDEIRTTSECVDRSSEVLPPSSFSSVWRSIRQPSGETPMTIVIGGVFFRVPPLLSSSSQVASISHLLHHSSYLSTLEKGLVHGSSLKPTMQGSMEPKKCLREWWSGCKDYGDWVKKSFKRKQKYEPARGHCSSWGSQCLIFK